MRKHLVIKVYRKNFPLHLKHYLLALQAKKHGGRVHELAGKMNMPESDILDFSANTNPLGTPFNLEGKGPDIEHVISSLIRKLDQYPDNRYLEFRNAAAGFVAAGIDCDNVVPGNGSCEILRLAIASVINEEDLILIPCHSSANYRHIAGIFGAGIERFSSKDLSSIASRTLERAKVVIIANPGYPAGELVSKDMLSVFAERCADKGTLLIVDESCIELCDPSMSVADLVTHNDHLLVIRSLSNIIGMPGIRLAFGIASSSMAALLNAARLSWNIGTIEETIGTAFLNIPGGQDSRYLSESRKLIRQEREDICKRLSGIHGLDPVKGDANYILVDVNDLFLDSVRLTEGLALHGVLIRECSDLFDGKKRYVRISVRPSSEFDIFIRALDEVFAELSMEDGREKLEEAIEHGGASAAGRGSCEYYPCHFTGQDCIFCFCPFYACQDERTGGKWIESSTGGQVWSCEKCNLLHRPKVARKVLDTLMEDGNTDENIRRAWKETIKPLL